MMLFSLCLLLFGLGCLAYGLYEAYRKEDPDE
jgi:hypothetical protein